MDTKLKKMIQELLARIDTLERENTRLEEEVEQLKKRLSKNSRNSSKPPSNDGLPRPNKNKGVSEQGKLKSKNTKKQSGGQKGHNGSNLRQGKPDKVVTKAVTSCEHCQSDLSHTSVQSYVSRQLHDLPGVTSNFIWHTMGSYDLNLNDHVSKIVIAPKKWLNDGKAGVDDIIPQSWIKM